MYKCEKCNKQVEIITEGYYNKSDIIKLPKRLVFICLECIGNDVDGYQLKITIDGVEYDKYVMDRKRISTKFWTSKDNNHKIACVCKYQAFTLRYGNYELFAKCTNCGLEDSVYSG